MNQRRLLWTIVTGLLLIVLVACGGNNSADNNSSNNEQTADQSSDNTIVSGDAAVGEELFNQVCIACHGPGGEGIEGLGKDMTTSEFIAGTSDAELLAFIKTGRPIGDPANTTGVDMPPKGGNPALSDEELIDIIAYIRTIQE